MVGKKKEWNREIMGNGNFSHAEHAESAEKALSLRIL